jgi:ArsR family transcriptional regulator
MTPLTLLKCLSEQTRLYSVLLIAQQSELCVCELTCALQISQPKISRHLAQLRECGILQDERRGQWVHYRIHPDLPTWAKSIIEQAISAEDALIPALQRLTAMGDRPQRITTCC